MTAPPELVIFDLDGTLTDSAPGIVSSFRHALAQVDPLPDHVLMVGDRPTVAALHEVLGV